MSDINPGKYIRRYSFWNPATWSIPSLYWDVFSQEQRVHAICKELGKVISYADYLGVNVDDIASRLKAIEEGQLDQYIIDAIEEWFENLQPTILSAILGGKLEVYVMSSRYTLTLVKVNNKVIVFDCGDADNAGDIVNFFSEHFVTHIDVLVITHYHLDHYSGFDTVADYCDENTDIYVQMNTPATNDDYTVFLNGRSYCNSVIASHNLKESVTPTQGLEYDYDGVKLTFWNTDPTYCAGYEASWANSPGASLDFDTTPATVTRVTSLNNYSLVTRVQFNGSSYVDTGDIEGAAQGTLAELMDPATVAKWPHHFVNRQGWLDFFNALKPQAWVVSHNNQSLNIAGTDIEPGQFMYYYMYRYLMYRQDSTPMISNIEEDVETVIINGSLVLANGRTYHYDSFPVTEQTAPAILPPNYYDENPFFFFTMSLDKFWDIRVAASSYPKFVLKANYQWQIGKAKFMQEIKQMFPQVSDYTEGRTIFIDFFDLPRIKFHSGTWGYNIIELLPSFTYASFLEGAIDYKKYSLGDAPRSIFPAEGTANWSADKPLSAEEYNLIRHSDRLIAVLDNNMIIPLIKTNSIGSDFGFGGQFSGTTMNTAGTALYFMSVSTGGSLVVNQVVLSSGNVNAQEVKEFRVIS